MITAGTDYWFTATAPTAVTDIVIANTDPMWGSGFEWEMHIVPNAAGAPGTKGVNTQILSTVGMNMAPPVGAAPSHPPVVFVGSQIFVNSIGGLSEKWLLDTGDSIVITLDDTTLTGFLGMTTTWANTSPNWVDNVIASMDPLSFSAADPLRPPGPYNGVTGISSGMPTFWWGPPVVGTFDIIVDGTGLVTSVTVVDGGMYHEIGDTITIPAAALGGANDFTMNVATLVDNKATVPCNLFINHIKI